MAAATLITIPFSHYCEKARWALDFAGVRYREQGHVPGLHRVPVRRSGSAASSVPVLVTDGRVLGDSSDILAYADSVAPAARKLLPSDALQLRESQALEDEFDRELGPHARRFIYFHLLPRRGLSLGLMEQRTPVWERAALRVVFPALRVFMRRFMDIDARTAGESRDRVLRVFDSVERRIAGGRRYLVGDRFTAADLTLAALAGPVGMLPADHHVRYPSVESLPLPAADLVRETRARPVGAYVRRMYEEHRGARS